MKKDELVYSSTSGSQKKKKLKKLPSTLPQAGPCKVRLETKGRGGKQVTVLFNLPFSEAQAKQLMKGLQDQLACGATFKEGMIQLRGDMRDRVEAYFKQANIKLVRAGG